MDLNRLQDRKKYNKWAKRKKSYSFYNGEEKLKRNKTKLLSGIGVLAVLLIGFITYDVLKDDFGIIYGDLMIVRQRDLGDHEFQVDQGDEDINALAKEYLATMGIEAKIAQLLITTPELLNGIGQVVQAGETTKIKLMHYPVGGLIYSGKNFETIVQLQKLINNTKLFTNYPTFLAMEETGNQKIVNTNNNLYSLGINMDCSDEGYYLVKENAIVSMDALKIQELYGRDPVDLLNDGAHMLVIKYSFITNHNKILEGVKSGRITEESINQKVIQVLEYKIKNQVE